PAPHPEDRGRAALGQDADHGGAVGRPELLRERGLPQHAGRPASGRAGGGRRPAAYGAAQALTTQGGCHRRSDIVRRCSAATSTCWPAARTTWWWSEEGSTGR